MPRTGILYREYRGRFAPTPSGPLHFGSLVAAVGSYLDARRNDGEWLVRIEDLDPPRVVPGAADAILRTLQAFGFNWDGEVVWQSSRGAAYRAAFDHLKQRGLCYPCLCPRTGCVARCRETAVPPGAKVSWRVPAQVPGAESDFVILRADGVFSYHLAVVVDDAEQGITNVVRGADLLDSTPRQNYLQRLLGYETPRYKHLPVARDAQGQKLSKQTCAPAISDKGDAQELAAAFRFLGLCPPEQLRTIAELWRWAILR